MSFRDHPHGLHKPNPSPNPVSKNAQVESNLSQEERAHGSRDPWYPPAWMEPWWICSVCHEKFPPSSSKRTSCSACHVQLCISCAKPESCCEECTAWVTSGGLSEDAVGCAYCPKCFQEGLCICGRSARKERHGNE